VLIAETQAFIGTTLEMAFRQELISMGLEREVVAVLTHVRINSRDFAFEKPTKPIGPLYTKTQLYAKLKKNIFSFVEDEGKYRRVVASPEPLRIMEIDAIKKLVDRNAIVIAAGGGGIPVIQEKGVFKEVDAVIDKDMTTQLLANSIRADTLAILTNVDCVYSDYENKTGRISSMKTKDIEASLNRFDEGTMRPKLRACMRFMKSGGREAYIGNLFRFQDILAGKSGTRIVR
jgi:carbamate kinase